MGIYNLVYSYYFGHHNGMILRLPQSKERIIKSVLEKIALNIKFLEKNKFKMKEWIRNYISEKKDKEKSAALIEEFDENDMLKTGLSSKQKRHRKQINGVTQNTKTLSPKQSLMLMITLFFVIISSCLIALWLYSVHKNTLII